jgi:mono/diheme cytochrome c family protein
MKSWLSRVVLVPFCCLVMGVLGIAESRGEGPSAHPRVLAFERFHSQGATANAEGGLLLLGELNCTSCHKADDSATAAVVRKQAPVLTEIGRRAKPEYLAKFLANPHEVKPGTTMPHVFAGLPAAEAAANAEALAQFLATTGTLDEGLPMKSAAIRGEKFFHMVGCVACHGPRGEGKTVNSAAIPLGTPSRKYSYAGMTQFLLNPLHVRPSGRMPSLQLTEREAGDIAAFLLEDTAQPSSLNYEYYEGSWEKLPDFDKLTPKASGSCEMLSVDLAERREQFGLRFTAVIEVKKEGNYNFYLSSDDGSRLSIDGQLVIDNDGIHGVQKKEGRFFLKQGRHSVEVLYFEQSGGEEMKLEVKGPGLELTGLESLLAPPEKPQPVVAATWVAKPELVAKGKELFQSAGCASCHELKSGTTPLASSFTAAPLANLKPTGGCLSAAPGAKHPFFALSAPQRQALASALPLAVQPPKPEPELLVQRHLARFNCYGCHQRGETGGVEESLNEYFTGTMKEVGDEARLPPHLTNVGSKLQPAWLAKVLAEGEKARPYMLTRMPKFGGANVGPLAAQLATADAGRVPPAPEVASADTDRKFKAAGKNLVGAQGLGCIKCHTFNGKGTPGIQVMDLTIMAERLQKDWYYHYMLNPPAFRPGTRMPAAWPGGQAVMKKVLGGDTPLQIRSTWAWLLDGKNAAEPAGLVEAKIELLPIDEPIIYRNFIDGAGPRAIAVGFPQKVHYAWDANHARLAMIWQGAFIDAGMHWIGRGPGYQKPLGDSVLKFSDSPPLALLTSDSMAWPKTTGRDEKDPAYRFLGYRLNSEQQPIFKYQFGSVTVEDFIAPHVQDDVATLVRQLKFTSPAKPQEPLYFLAAAGDKLQLTPENVVMWGEQTRIKLAGPAAPRLRQSEGRTEVMLAVPLEQGSTELKLEYEW